MLEYLGVSCLGTHPSTLEALEGTSTDFEVIQDIAHGVSVDIIEPVVGCNLVIRILVRVTLVVCQMYAEVNVLELDGIYLKRYRSTLSCLCGTSECEVA